MKQSPRSKPPSWPTVIALTLLTACGTTVSKPTNSCGVLYSYDEQTESQAAHELEAMRTASVYPVTREMMEDYHTTRETIRACSK